MNLSRNKEIFTNGITIGLKGIEKISNYVGFDLNGLTDELMQDSNFQLDLQIISCETDLTAYVNPRSSAFLKILRKAYEVNQRNEIENKIKNVINDKDKFDRINNLK